MRNHHPCNLPNREKGAVLLVALMLLIVLTMLGVSTTQTSSIETRMAYNMQEYVHAFGAAEVGIGIVRNYDLGVFTGISESEKKILVDSSEIPRTDKTNYVLSYQTKRVDGDFPDNSGRYGAGSARLAHYITTSTGRSTEDAAAPKVVLKAGTAQPVPTSKNVTSTSLKIE